MDVGEVVCLVTGAARRIGRELASALGSRGARVVLHCHRSGVVADEAAEAVRRAGGAAAILRADLSSEEEVRRLGDEAERPFGPVEILVNNAAVFYPTPLESLDGSTWDHVLGVNLKAPAFLALRLGLRMKRRGRGKIVNVADWAGERPYAGYLPYCISKAGLLAMTRALAKELAPEVQVNAVSPGPVLPPDGMPPAEMAEALRRTPLGRVGSPADVVAATMFFIEGTDFSTGANLPVDGGRMVY